VVTAHRRENFGAGMESVCAAVEQLASRPDVQIVYPVHPNPNASAPALERLRHVPNIRLTEPLDYVSFVDLMRRAYLLLTDSGGVQEEAPSLGKPVLVMRQTTERPEAVQAGTAVLTGADTEAIVSATASLLDDSREYERRSLIHNPYGDGHASERITAKILDYLR
jgi:UDP-N-acetylglucosamine 2-epimerase (non-hydrolysing)